MSELSLARFKTCTICGCTKPVTLAHFHRHKTTKSGYMGQCRVCNTLRASQHYHAKRESILAYRKENKDWILPYNRRWKALNKERVAQARRQYYEQNKDREKATMAAYKKANPRYNATGCSNRRSRLRGSNGSHTHKEIEQMYDDQGGVCAYCQRTLNGAYEVDHMLPLSRGGGNSWDNLAVTCQPCNRSKHDKSVEEFYTEYLA